MRGDCLASSWIHSKPEKTETRAKIHVTAAAGRKCHLNLTPGNQQLIPTTKHPQQKQIKFREFKTDSNRKHSLSLQNSNWLVWKASQFKLNSKIYHFCHHSTKRSWQFESHTIPTNKMPTNSWFLKGTGMTVSYAKRSATRIFSFDPIQVGPG